MTDQTRDSSLEEQIGRWRDYLRRRQAIHPVDVAELEDHLREQITSLTEAGLSDDEASRRRACLETRAHRLAEETRWALGNRERAGALQDRRGVHPAEFPRCGSGRRRFGTLHGRRS